MIRKIAFLMVLAAYGAGLAYVLGVNRKTVEERAGELVKQAVEKAPEFANTAVTVSEKAVNTARKSLHTVVIKTKTQDILETVQTPVEQPAETLPASEEPVVQQPGPRISPEELASTPVRLSRLLGDAILVVHAPDGMSESLLGADAKMAALADTLWFQYSSNKVGWGVRLPDGRNSLVPIRILYEIAGRLEEKLRATPKSVYRVNVYISDTGSVAVDVDFL